MYSSETTCFCFLIKVNYNPEFDSTAAYTSPEVFIFSLYFFFFQMLKSIVLKNFVHFKDKIVIVLNNSQTEQRKEQSTNAGANTSPIDSYALNNS